MSDLLTMMARHGYALTFALLFAEAIGLPFPAASRWWQPGRRRIPHSVGLGCSSGRDDGLLIGDTAQFWLGRYTAGPCSVSLPPVDES